MASTEELEAQILAEMESNPEAYAVEENNVLLIDNDLRTIFIPEGIKNLGVESDDDVHRLYFQMPKTYGEFDLSTFDIRINYKNGNIGDVYAVEDKKAEGDVITFSWLVGRNAVKTKGTTQFIVCLKKSDSSGIVQQEFNTTVASLNVLEGLETTEQVIQANADTIEQILKKIDGLTSISPEDIANAVDEWMQANPFTETDPTVPDWAKQPEKPTYTASEVGADTAGTAESKVSEHNVALDAHNDIRLLVQGLATRLNALADSDDTTLDQMSEVVSYIKSNKSLIDAITTSKINVSDIIDNLTTNVSNKPLSAAQGVALKALIDGITIPEKLPNPQKLTFAGAVTAEYDGSGAVTVTIPEGSGGSGGTIRIEKLSTDTAVELEPNKLYIFPEMSELTITLAEPSDTGIANEYHFVFQSGATATTLTIPDTVKIPSGFAVDARKIYEVSILEGCLCAQSWAVS